MKIKILGNGGAISEGLVYNSFLAGKSFLVETPPDIMNSLFREKIQLSDITSIFISHFHADHFFGFPFIALRMFFDGSQNIIRVFGPCGIKERSCDLCSLAFGEIHPMMRWLETNVHFIEISSGKSYEVDGTISFEPLRMSHFIETFGFRLFLGGTPRFCYFADSVWISSLTQIVKNFSGVVLTDLNGEPGDNPAVHISERDIIENCPADAEERVIFYGTHLKSEKKSTVPFIRYVSPGDEILI